MPSPPRLAALAALLLLPAALAQEPAKGTIQQMVDDAPTSGILAGMIRLPPGNFNESVLIEKDLLVIGSGHGWVDGGDRPAFVVRNASVVRLDFVEMHSLGTPLLVQNTSYFEMWGPGNFSLPPRLEHVGWFRLIIQPDKAPPLFDLVDTPWSHAHPVRLLLQRADSSPLADAAVRIYDGDRLVVTLLGDAYGVTASYPIAHAWSSPTASGTNTTTAEIEGVPGRFPVDPHAPENIIRTSVVASSPSSANPLVVLAIPVALVALAAALSLDEGFRWAWMNAFRGYYLRAARKEQAGRPGARDAIAAHIAQHPGASLRELGKALNLGDGTLLEHLRALEAEGRVKATRAGRRRQHAVVPQGDAEPGSTPAQPS